MLAEMKQASLPGKKTREYKTQEFSHAMLIKAIRLLGDQVPITSKLPPGGIAEQTGLDRHLVAKIREYAVYGFSNAATHSWETSSTWGFLAAGVALLVAFAFWQFRAAQPLLPPRVVLDRNRGGAYLTVLINGAAMFGVFLFLVYYMQTDLGYSAITSGVALLPMVTLTAVTTIVGNVALMPRVGPKPLVTAGFLINAAGMAWLTGIDVDSGYASALLGPILVVGIGMGLIYGAAFATGTSGVEPRDAGIASGSVSTGQQLGGAIGTALLNTIAASATADYLASHVNGQPAPLQVHLAAIHGYTTVFWWCTGIYAAGALICGTLLRRVGLPLHERAPAAEPSRQAEATQSGELSPQAEEVGS
jgi:hypothetical protein